MKWEQSAWYAQAKVRYQETLAAERKNEAKQTRRQLEQRRSRWEWAAPRLNEMLVKCGLPPKAKGDVMALDGVVFWLISDTLKVGLPVPEPRKNGPRIVTAWVVNASSLAPILRDLKTEAERHRAVQSPRPPEEITEAGPELSAEERRLLDILQGLSDVIKNKPWPVSTYQRYMLETLLFLDTRRNEEW